MPEIPHRFTKRYIATVLADVAGERLRRQNRIPPFEHVSSLRRHLDSIEAIARERFQEEDWQPSRPGLLSEFSASQAKALLIVLYRRSVEEGGRRAKHLRRLGVDSNTIMATIRKLREQEGSTP